jgi:TRAP-type C4-dicarboxylate transport system permease small subunit
MAIFTDETKKKVSDFFVDFYELHKNDILCQPGIIFIYLVYLMVSVVTLMFGWVGYAHAQVSWEETYPGVPFDQGVVGWIGYICLILGGWLILVTAVVIVLITAVVAVGSTIVKKREAVKNAQLEMWEV